MSTLNVENIQHPSSSTPAISLDSNGAMTGSFPYPNRNLIYNGAMQVHQRGTSSTGITSGGYYTADRWETSIISLGTWSQSIESDGPTGSGFTKSLKMLCTTADASPASGDRAFLRQRLEGQDIQRIAKGTSSAKQFTMSFWVKSNVTGTYAVRFYDADNGRNFSSPYTISSAEAWEYKTVTVPADTIGAFDNDNSGSLHVFFWLDAGTQFTSGAFPSSWETNNDANVAPGTVHLGNTINNYWQVTGVQLETGPVATEFEFEPYGTTLAKCQRYYYKMYPNAADRTFGLAFNRNTTLAQAFIAFPNTMRIAPTALETTGTASDYQVVYLTTGATCNAVPFFDGGSSHGSDLYFQVSSGLTAGQASKIASKSTNSYLAWSAEL